jgi:hypothetical protein
MDVRGADGIETFVVGSSTLRVLTVAFVGAGSVRRNAAAGFCAMMTSAAERQRNVASASMYCAGVAAVPGLAASGVRMQRPPPQSRRKWNPSFGTPRATTR